MKKIFGIALALLLLLIPSLSKANENSVTLLINGAPATYDESDGSVFIEDGRTFVPIRLIMEKLGFKVDYNNDTKEITIKNSEQELKMAVGSQDYEIDGVKKSMDVTPKLISDRVHIPIRFIAESFGKEVQWNEKNYAVIIGNYYDPDTEIKDPVGVTLQFEDYKLQMRLPKEVHKRLTILSSENATVYNFYDKLNHDKKDDFDGLICSITKSEGSALGIVPGFLIKYEDGNFYEVIFASDVRYDYKDPETSKSYEDLREILIEVLKTAQIVEK